ncbi:MAG TPA: hypothetical protein DEH00_00595, partial [Candidatus Marinimicrobia bacterium]|nr:hypothetical protein [Candidatus Neomarinimicrobiota bacterium]
MTVDTRLVNNTCFLMGTHLYFIVDMKKFHRKYVLSVAAILLMAWSSAFAWNGLGTFDAYVQNGKIVVEWQTKHEENVD